MKVGDLVRCISRDDALGVIVKAIYPQSPDYPARHKPLRYEVMVMGCNGRHYSVRPSQLEVINESR